MDVMRRHAVVFALLLTAAAYAEKARKPVPAQPAGTYAMHQTISHVTIAAEPGDTKQTRPNTRLDYFSYGLLPIRVIVTNDSETPVILDDARIHFISASNDNLPAATQEEI